MRRQHLQEGVLKTLRAHTPPGAPSDIPPLPPDLDPPDIILPPRTPPSQPDIIDPPPEPRPPPPPRPDPVPERLR